MFGLEEYLHNNKAFPSSHSTPPESRLKVDKKLGGDTTWRADLNWPKYSMPYNVILCNKNWGEGVLGDVAITRRLSWHHCACGRWWSPLFPPPPSSFLHLLNYLYLDSCFCSSCSLTCPTGAGGSEQAAVWCLAAGLSQHITAVHISHPGYHSDFQVTEGLYCLADTLLIHC